MIHDEQSDLEIDPLAKLKVERYVHMHNILTSFCVSFIYEKVFSSLTQNVYLLCKTQKYKRSMAWGTDLPTHSYISQTS